jgi:hypothetical protein
MRITKFKTPKTTQGTAYGVSAQSKTHVVGARLNVEMNLRNTQNKRRRIVRYAKLDGFEDWQLKIFAKNAKKGIVFFRPDHFEKQTPRSAYEAWGGTYNRDTTEKDEERNSKIMLALATVVLLILSVL